MTSTSNDRSFDHSEKPSILLIRSLSCWPDFLVQARNEFFLQDSPPKFRDYRLSSSRGVLLHIKEGGTDLCTSSNRYPYLFARATRQIAKLQGKSQLILADSS